MNPNGTNELFFGNPLFFLKEFVAVTVTAVYAFVFTYVALWLINKITPERVSEETETNGLDLFEFGEEAYVE